MSTPQPINDSRLTADMDRVRNGPTQLFYDHGDRRTAVAAIDPDQKHLYAELIDGVWCWVNGCAECNGQPRDWMTYIECEKHNVCRDCRTPRSQLTEAPWGRRGGWQCKPCASIEHEAEKATALAAMPEEHDDMDYHYEDKPRCPYCDLQFEVESEEIDGMLSNEEERQCERCDHIFTIEAEMSITYSTNRTDD